MPGRQPEGPSLLGAFSVVRAKPFRVLSPPRGNSGNECIGSLAESPRHSAKVIIWEHSSAGRASALQAEGQRFESVCSHHYASVVQRLVYQPSKLGTRVRFPFDAPVGFPTINLLLLNLGKWVLGLLSWAIGSVGRAPALQAGGRGFESRTVHHAADTFIRDTG